MIKLYSPRNEIELAIIKSIFESEDVQFYVHNDHYGSLKIGPRIDLLNAKTIYVDPNSEDKAKDLLSNYLQNIKEDKKDIYKSEYTLWDKIRVIIESLLFGWFMPGKRWNKKHQRNNKKPL